MTGREADEVEVTARPFPGTGARALLRRLRDARGYSLSELITVMAIMVTVITALASVFVSGSNAEIDLSNRFQAQSDARMTLDRFRREAHNSCNLASTTASAVTLYSLSGGTCSVPTTWCAVGSGLRYKLYRKPGATCDATGTRWADHLVSNAVFSVFAPSAGTLPRVGIKMTIDLKPADTNQRYVLDDAIALRNYLRSA